MKTLRLTDSEGNGPAYELCLPDSMDRWQVDSLRSYLRMSLPMARNEGFLVEPPDRMRHETLRRLVAHSSSAFRRPVQFVQNDVLLDDFCALDTRADLSDVLMVRDESASLGNPRALSLADCNHRAFLSCPAEVVRCVDALFKFSDYAVHDRRGNRIASFSELVKDFPETLDATNQLRVLFRIAKVVHARPFENSSKVIAGIPFCAGLDMWGRMEQGGGGICAEKTGALKFICDVLGVSTFYAAGSQYTIPDDYERQLKRYVVSEGDADQPVWIQHLLLGFTLDGQDYLTDVANGNLPFLFLSGTDLQRYLHAGYRARMVYHVEQMNLRRISNWAGDALLTLCEFHVPDLQFQYIFDQSLGLHVSSELYIGVFFDYGGIRTARYQAHYTALAKPLRLPSPRFIHEANLRAVPDDALREMLTKVLDGLRTQYANPHYTGDFTLVLQPLNRGKIPARISRDVQLKVGELE